MVHALVKPEYILLRRSVTKLKPLFHNTLIFEQS